MALKAVIKDLNEVEAALRSQYVKEGDVYVLDVDDEITNHPKTKALATAHERSKKERNEAKDQVKSLMAQIEKYKDIDPEKAREALAKLDQLEDKELLDGEKVEELIDKRTQRMKSDFEKQLKAKDDALSSERQRGDGLYRELEELKVFGAVKDAALAKGARKAALTDIANRARSIFKLVDGKATAMKGDEVVYGKKGEPLTIEEWVDSVAVEADYLFEPAKGGGGQGGQRQQQAGVQFVDRSAAGGMLEKIASGEVAIR